MRELVEMGSWGKPDPERWLPWHMRSYNKKLVKKRKGNTVTASGGAQGGAGVCSSLCVRACLCLCLYFVLL